jgi:hypothetical protein
VGERGHARMSMPTSMKVRMSLSMRRSVIALLCFY